MSTNSPPLSALDSVIGSLISSVLVLVAVAALVMLVMGGFQYLASAGNKEGAAKATRTITYSVAGVVLAVSAWMIINLIGQFLGVNFRTFTICVSSPC